MIADMKPKRFCPHPIASVALTIISLTPFGDSALPARADTRAASPPLFQTNAPPVLTRVKGNVRIRPSAGGAPSPAKRLQPIRPQGSLVVSGGAEAWVVCSNDRELRIPGDVRPVGGRITDEVCARGRQLPAGSYLSVRPDGGRIKSVGGSLELEGEARGEDDDINTPDIMSPLEGAVDDTRPKIAWVGVPGAVQYELNVNGPEEVSVTYDAAQVRCTTGTGAQISICEAPFPAGKSLKRGVQYVVSLGARKAITDPFRRAESISVTVLSEAQSGSLAAELRAIGSLGEDDVLAHLLRAGVYGKYRLYTEAAGAYQQATAADPLPAAHVTLGDVYRTAGLNQPAFESYQRALSLASSQQDDAARAAAEYGLGMVAYTRKRFADAAAHFRNAETLYVALNLPAETEASRKAAEEAGRH
jgi:hypothetical protein